MRLTKEEFVEAVNTYQKMSRQESSIMNMLDASPEWKPGTWVDEYYNLLSNMCELEENDIYGTDLDWFCFDTAFGENEEFTKVYDGATEWNITSPEILYDFIMYQEEHSLQQKERLISLFLI